MQVRILGELEVLDADARLIRVVGRRQRALLALLATRPSEVVSSDRLVDALWGNNPPGNAPNALQTVVSRLRRAVGDDRVLTRPPGYVLDVQETDVDAMRFERLADEGRRALPPAIQGWRARSCAPRSACGGERRWRSFGTASSRASRRPDSRTAGSLRSKTGSRPTSRWADTSTWSRRSARSRPQTRCESGCTRWICLRCTERDVRPRHWHATGRSRPPFGRSTGSSPAGGCGSSRGRCCDRTRRRPAPSTRHGHRDPPPGGRSLGRSAGAAACQHRVRRARRARGRGG